jgi:hypothetical protein
VPYRHTLCEFHLNFLSFEAFEGQKAGHCSLLHLPLFARRSPTMKRHMMAHRSISVNFRFLDRLFRKEYSEKQQARNNRRGDELIDRYISSFGRKRLGLDQGQSS